MKGKWTFSDAEDFFNELQKRKVGQMQEESNVDQVIHEHVKEKMQDKDSPTKVFLDKV